MCCGKELTNPISRHYGIGPVCLSKMGISRDIEDVAGIKEDLAKSKIEPDNQEESRIVEEG